MAYQKKSYKKFVATAASATLVASAIVPVASAASFSDVEEKHEFATYIDAAVEAGYVKGYADGTFGINDNLKRSQVVIIIGRYLESLGYESEETTSPWSDVTDAEVIKYGNIVKDAGVFTGYTDGTLKGNDFITRENMAVVLDRLAETVTGMSLSDVAEYIEDIEVADLATANAAYQSSIQALRDLEISTADNFNPKGNLKRGQFAKFIINAVEAIDALATVTAEDIAQLIADVDATLPAVEDITADSAEAAKATVEAAKTEIAAIKEKIEVTGLTGEEVAELEKAIEAVEAKFAAIIEAADKAIEAAKPLAVESVTAINGTTLQVTGAGLKGLKAENITIAGNSLTKVEASEDGKTATVTLAGALVPDKEVKVSVKVGEETKEFTVKYSISAADVAVQAGVFDDNTANQRVTVLIKGQAISVDALKTAGYTVEFKGYNLKNEDVTYLLFQGGNAVNTNGVLSTNNNIGSYKVQVTLKKGSEVQTSALADIEIRNLDNAATATEGYKIKTSEGITVTDTLVVGETANLTELFVGNGVAVTGVNVKNSKDFTITTSDSSVIQVTEDKTGSNYAYKFTATGLGKATLTIKVGNATKTVELNVKGEQRKVTAVTGDNVIKPIVVDGNGVKATNEFNFKAVDQYGNALSLTKLAEIKVEFPTSVEGTATPLPPSRQGVVTVKVEPTKGGQSGTIVFKDKDGNIIGTSSIQTTAVNNKNNIVFYTEAADHTINANDVRDNEIVYELHSYTSENVFHSKFIGTDYENYTISYNEKLVTVEAYDKIDSNTPDQLVAKGSNGVITLPSATDYIKVTPKTLAGTTDLEVKNKLGQVVAKRQVTVATAQPAITGITWADSKTINYVTGADFTKAIKFVEASNSADYIVEGLTFSQQVVNKVRIKFTTVGSKQVGQLYLDKNDNGVQDSSDDILGQLEAFIAVDPSFTNLKAGDVNPYNGFFTDGTNPIGAGSKGYVSYVLRNADGDVVATKAISVDVAQSQSQQQVAASEAAAKVIETKIANATASTVTLTADDFKNITTPVTIKVTKPLTVALPHKLNNSNVTFDFNNATTVASTLTVAVPAGETPSASIGGLVVNTKEADFTVDTGITVTGVTDIKDVKSATFINKGILSKVTISDTNGTSFNNAGSVAELTLEGKGAVILEGNKPTKSTTVKTPDQTITAPKDFVIEAEAATTINTNEVAAGSTATVTGDTTITQETAGEKAQAAVNKVAAEITSTPAINAGKLVLPTVPEGYTVAVKTSDKDTVIALDGTVTNTYVKETVNVVLEVKDTKNNVVASTKSFAIEVDAKAPEAAKVTVRGNGPTTADGDANFDYANAYKAAGVTFDENTKTVTVNQSELTEFVSKKGNDTKDAFEAILKADLKKLYIGLQFEAPEGATHAQIGDVKAELAVNGANVHNGKFIWYYSFAEETGIANDKDDVVQSITWLKGEEVIKKETLTIKTKVNRPASN